MRTDRVSRGRALAAATALALCGAAHAAPAEARPRRILAIHTLEAGVPASQVFTAGLRAALPLGSDLAFYTEYLDRSRFPAPDYAAGFRTWLRQKYAASPPDVILAIGPDAIDFLADPTQTPFQGIPVVFGFAAEHTVAGRRLPPTWTGVVDHLPIQETLELARALFPETRHVALVGGASPFDRSYYEVLRREVLASGSGLEVLDLVGLPMSDLLLRLRTLPPQSVVLALTFLKDGSGRQWTGPQSVPAMASASSAPLFGFFAHVVGQGIAGGVCADLGDSGKLVAETALRVLAGEAPEAIGVRRSGQGRAILDARQLQRWGVPERRVPAGAVVRFAEPSLWARHGWWLVAATVGFVLQSALIAVLLYERRELRRAEARAREDFAVIAHMNRVGAIGEIAGSFAHELNSPLGAVLNNAQAARRFLASGPGREADVRACLDDIVGDVKRAGEVVRRVRGALRKESWNPVELDLAAAIRDALRLVTAEARDRKVTLEVQVAPLPPVSGDDVQLVQVIVNLLMNAIEAASPMGDDRRRVRVEAKSRDDAVVVRVLDWGPGVPPSDAARVFERFFTTKASGLGMGLPISKSIVEAHGGTISVSRLPDGGAAFEVVLPGATDAAAVKAAS